MLSMCHAQQDAASHQPRKDIELSSCAKAPTDRAAPRGFYLDLQSVGAAAWPLAARAQQGAIPVIGLLSSVTARQWAPWPRSSKVLLRADAGADAARRLGTLALLRTFAIRPALKPTC